MTHNNGDASSSETLLNPEGAVTTVTFKGLHLGHAGHWGSSGGSGDHMQYIGLGLLESVGGGTEYSLRRSYLKKERNDRCGVGLSLFKDIALEAIRAPVPIN